MQQYDSWGPVPPPFNPLYNPNAKTIHNEVIASLVRDNYYGTYTRKEIALEFKVRYEKLIKETTL